MGYFPNGTSGMIYDEKYCHRCAHMLPEPLGCPCHTAHLLWNYDECNNDDSILHKMIPRKDGFNEKCIFFTEKIPENDFVNEIESFVYTCKICGDKIGNTCSRCSELMGTKGG